MYRRRNPQHGRVILGIIGLREECVVSSSVWAGQETITALVLWIGNRRIRMLAIFITVANELARLVMFSQIYQWLSVLAFEMNIASATQKEALPQTFCPVDRIIKQWYLSFATGEVVNGSESPILNRCMFHNRTKSCGQSLSSIYEAFYSLFLL